MRGRKKWICAQCGDMGRGYRYVRDSGHEARREIRVMRQCFHVSGPVLAYLGNYFLTDGDTVWECKRR